MSDEGIARRKQDTDYREYFALARRSLQAGLGLYSDLKDDSGGASYQEDYDERLRKGEELDGLIWVAAVFSAFALEAFVNDYMATREGLETYNRRERMSPVRKWKIVFSRLTGAQIPDHSPIVQDLEMVFNKRNNIAHQKTEWVHLRWVRRVGGDVEYHHVGADSSILPIEQVQNTVDAARRIIEKVAELDPELDISWLSHDWAIDWVIRNSRLEVGEDEFGKGELEPKHVS